jgi:hypothetical protein
MNERDTPQWTMADLVHEVTGIDVNGLDERQYRLLVAEVKRATSADERERFYWTGLLPVGVRWV